ncbi:MAG: hypothetical protein WCI05_18395, partial [Myxococcales bacterium]
PSFGKRTPFTRAHFAEFEKVYGEDPHGKSPRQDLRGDGRFRKFTREEIEKRGDNLDISWLKDDSVTDHADLPEPEEIAAEIVVQCEALARIEGASAMHAPSQHNLGPTIANLERSLLAKAFRGELVPQDPTDEPAEAMLARVRGTAGATRKPGRGKRGVNG